MKVLAELGDAMLGAWARWHLGELLYHQGDLAQARRVHEEAFAERKRSGVTIFAAESQLSLAVLAIEEGRAAEGDRLVRQALPEFQRRQSVSNEILAEAVLAAALLAQGKAAAAREGMGRAAERAERLQHVLVKLAVAPIAARVRASTGAPADLAAATAALERALQLARDSGVVTAEMEIRLALGELERAAGRAAEGTARLRALAAEAARRGFGLVARRAAARSPGEDVLRPDAVVNLPARVTPARRLRLTPDQRRSLMGP